MRYLFCLFFRWILLCFKREFPEASALRIWETCWAHYQTDYFHLFICVAIVAIYGEDIVEQGLAADEMLLHFSSLAMHMNGDIVLRKVRYTRVCYTKVVRSNAVFNEFNYWILRVWGIRPGSEISLYYLALLTYSHLSIRETTVVSFRCISVLYVNN